MVQKSKRRNFLRSFIALSILFILATQVIYGKVFTERSYVYGNGMLVGRVDHTETSRERYYYHLDRLKSVTSITDDSGQVRAVYDYFPYGTPIEYFEDVGNEFKFKSNMLDEEIMMYGTYSPTLGRHLVPSFSDIDAFNPQTFNPYSYDLNNPLSEIETTNFELEMPEAGPIAPQPEMLYTPKPSPQLPYSYEVVPDMVGHLHSGLGTSPGLYWLDQDRRFEFEFNNEGESELIYPRPPPEYTDTVRVEGVLMPSYMRLPMPQPGHESMDVRSTMTVEPWPGPASTLWHAILVGLNKVRNLGGNPPTTDPMTALKTLKNIPYIIIVGKRAQEAGFFNDFPDGPGLDPDTAEQWREKMAKQLGWTQKQKKMAVRILDSRPEILAAIAPYLQKKDLVGVFGDPKLKNIAEEDIHLVYDGDVILMAISGDFPKLVKVSAEQLMGYSFTYSVGLELKRMTRENSIIRGLLGGSSHLFVGGIFISARALRNPETFEAVVHRQTKHMVEQEIRRRIRNTEVYKEAYELHCEQFDCTTPEGQGKADQIAYNVAWGKFIAAQGDFNLEETEIYKKIHEESLEVICFNLLTQLGKCPDVCCNRGMN